MMNPLIPVTLLALAVPAAVQDAGQADVQLAQLTIHERIVIRVPRVSPPAPAPLGARAAAPPIEWKEKKGPKCIAAGDLGGAMISQPDSVDLILNGGQRIRAELDDDCGPLDYYSGFYVRPANDGQVCAGRDVIRIRSGGSCEIHRFRKLVASR